MFNAQSINKSNKQTNKQTTIGLILVILLAIFLSTFSTHSRSQEINVELGGGCETVVQFISMVPAFSLYRVGAYGAASVWAAASPYVAQGTSMDTILEMTNALTYIHSSYNQGYWHHKRANDNNITFDIK